MKQRILLWTAALAASAALAQTPIGQQRISSPPPTNAIAGETNQLGSVTVTNQTGATYSLNDLAGQLGSLRAAVEQTVPVLAAFNAHFATNSPTTSQIAGAISGVLSRALGRNSNQNSTASSSGVSPGISNFAQVLSGLITTNTNNAASVSLDPNTLSQLQTLQRDLNPVLTTLQNLHVANNLGGTAPLGSTTAQPDQSGNPSRPAPTGR